MSGYLVPTVDSVVEAPVLSSDDESNQAQQLTKQQRYGRLKVKSHLHKIHTGRKWFDSGEYYAAKQGVQLQDLLPGGAPVGNLPAKLEPTSYAGPRGRSHLQLAATHGAPPASRQAIAGAKMCEY